MLPMAFRDVSARRHVGLQQLSSLASAGRTFLGSAESHKFIVDEVTQQSTLVCSAVRLMESLDLTSAAGQLLHETVQAQNREFKTGTSTLLFLVGAWSSAVLECLQQNVPVPAIVAVMSEGLNSCCERVQCLQIPIQDLNKELCSSRVRPRAFEGKTGPVGHGGLTNPWDALRFQRDISAAEEAVPISSRSHRGGDCSSDECLLSPRAGFGSAVAAVGDTGSSALPGSGVSAVASCVPGKLTHSRHFGTLGKSRFSRQQGNFQRPLSGPSADERGCGDFGPLAAALGRGSQTCVKLLQSIAAYQQERAGRGGSSQIDVAEVVTCCVLGPPESCSCVSPGFVTLVWPEQAAVIKRLADKALRVVLLDGDLTERYRHLGFNAPGNVSAVREHPGPQAAGAGDQWLDRTWDALTGFEVSLVLVRGAVCERLAERCAAGGILQIGGVAGDVLRAFAAATGARPVSYPSQLRAACVGSGARAELWPGRAPAPGQRLPVRIGAGDIALLTAVLTAALPAQAQLLQDRFWTLLHRLQHALRDGRVFPGGGAVELLCLSHLRALAARPGPPGNGRELPGARRAECQPLVLRALASGWRRYLAVLLCNAAAAGSELQAAASVEQQLQRAAACGSPSAYILQEFRRGGPFRGGCDPSPEPVCDNVSAKTEAWRRALDLVLLVLQTDAEIITGPRRNEILESPASSEFMFL